MLPRAASKHTPEATRGLPSSRATAGTRLKQPSCGHVSEGRLLILQAPADDFTRDRVGQMVERSPLRENSFSNDD